jgi:hypothetical protein
MLKPSPALTRTITPAFRRLLARQFPDMELGEVVKLLDMGLLRLKRVRCAAMSRNPPRPCAAMAIPGKAVCRNHGGLSFGPSEKGRKRISAFQKARWAKWREENGRPVKASCKIGSGIGTLIAIGVYCLMAYAVYLGLFY